MNYTAKAYKIEFILLVYWHVHTVISYSNMATKNARGLFELQIQNSTWPSTWKMAR